MVVQLLYPLWLWGLLGLAVPILIHLLHKRSRQVVQVGSLQPFRGGEPIQAKRLRPNELWLLLLRCLLLGLFVLVLAEPVLYQTIQEKRKLVYVAPELVATFNRDSALAAGLEPRVLQPGLPLLEESPPPDSSAYSYWDVFREIDASTGTSDTALLYFYPWLQRFVGQRPALAKRFIAVATTQPLEKPQLFAALRQEGEELLLRWWQAEKGMWRIKEQRVPLADSAAAMEAFAAAIPVQAPDTIQVVLQYSEDYEREVQMWAEAFSLIDSLLPAVVIQTDQASVQAAPPQAAGVWVWLAEEAPPAAFNKAHEAVRFQLGAAQGSAWFSPLAAHQKQYTLHYSLQKQQNNRQRLASFLPQLMALLPLPAEAHPPLLLAEEQWQPKTLSNTTAVNLRAALPLANWFLIALLFIFMVERWLSLQK